MKILVALATGLILLSASPSQAAVLWFMGVETGDTREGTSFGSVGTQCTAVTAAGLVKTGNYGMQCGDRSSRGFQGFGGTTAFARTWFQWTASNTDNERVITGSGTSAGLIELRLRQSDKKLIFVFNGGSTIAASSTALTVSTWYLLEVQQVIHASTGGMELKINGSTEFTSFGTNTSAMVAFDNISFGGTASLNTHTFIYDDMMICSAAYCPTGGSIARQGLSGTPTYDAWTKAGTCSGGNISTCWSATPFSTAASATSIVASDAQTMLVSGFGTTQSGHGTETIAAHDTINACKTALIAKTAVASGISIRRRINGSDTDTAKTLTTSDAYYDDGIWTTTADILRTNTNEIGAIHGTGVNLDTVEDAWLMCDYLAVASPTRHRVTQ